MDLEQRMNKLEKAFGAQDALVRELRDAVTVTTELEVRQRRALPTHGEWLAEHDVWVKERKAAMKDLDERIASLVSEFGEFMRRRN